MVLSQVALRQSLPYLLSRVDEGLGISLVYINRAHLLMAIISGSNELDRSWYSRGGGPVNQNLYHQISRILNDGILEWNGQDQVEGPLLTLTTKGKNEAEAIVDTLNSRTVEALLLWSDITRSLGTLGMGYYIETTQPQLSAWEVS